MKLSSLKIVTNEQTTQSPAALRIEDTLPPQIHAVVREPMRRRRIVQRLDVDGVLARSLPKTLVETVPLQQ